MGKRSKLGLSIGLIVGALASAMLLGNTRDGKDKQVHLAAVTGGEFSRTELVKSRKDIFGSDALDTSAALDAKFHFESKATKEKINGKVDVTGTLTAGTERFPVRFSADTETVKNAQGHDFSSGVTTGAVKVRGKDIPATLFVSSIPDEDKYVVTIAVQPADGSAAVFAFGTPFREYTDKFQPQVPDQLKEGK